MRSEATERSKRLVAERPMKSVTRKSQREAPLFYCSSLRSSLVAQRRSITIILVASLFVVSFSRPRSLAYIRENKLRLLLFDKLLLPLVLVFSAGVGVDVPANVIVGATAGVVPLIFSLASASCLRNSWISTSLTANSFLCTSDKRSKAPAVVVFGDVIGVDMV